MDVAMSRMTREGDSLLAERSRGSPRDRFLAACPVAMAAGPRPSLAWGQEGAIFDDRPRWMWIGIAVGFMRRSGVSSRSLGRSPARSSSRGNIRGNIQIVHPVHRVQIRARYGGHSIIWTSLTIRVTGLSWSG